MKKLMLLFLILFLQPLVSGMYETKIYDNWIKTGIPISIDGTNFTFDYMRESNSTIIRFQKNIIIIDPKINNCAKEGSYSFCQTKQKFFRGSFEVPPGVSSKEINTSLYFKINSSTLGLNFSKSFDTQIFYTNYPTLVTLKISRMNKNQDISNIRFNDSYDDDFKIVDLSYCQKDDNLIYIRTEKYETDLTCKYMLIPLKNGTSTSTTSIAYDIDGKSFTKRLDTKLIIQPMPLSIGSDIEIISLIVGESLRLNISLTPIEEIEIKELSIAIPKNLMVMNKSDSLRLVQNTLKINNLKLDKKMDYFIILNSTRTGNYRLNISADYTYPKSLSKISKMIKIDYTFELFDIELFRKTNYSILRISNGKQITYDNVILKIDNKTYEIDKLEPKRFKEFKIKNIYNDTVDIKFYTAFGEYIKLSRKLNISKKDAIENKSIENTVQPIVNQAEISEKQKEKTLSGIFIIFGICLGALFIFIFLKKGSSKSQLDREIEEIKKQEKKG